MRRQSKVWMCVAILGFAATAVSWFWGPLTRAATARPNGLAGCAVPNSITSYASTLGVYPMGMGFATHFALADTARSRGTSTTDSGD